MDMTVLLPPVSAHDTGTYLIILRVCDGGDFRAVPGGRLLQYVDIARASDNEMREKSPRPGGLPPEKADCRVARPGHIPDMARTGRLALDFSGDNASRGEL